MVSNCLLKLFIKVGVHLFACLYLFFILFFIFFDSCVQSGIQSQLRVILQRREVRASLWDHLKRGANVSRHDPNDTFVEHVYNGQAFAEWKNRAKPGDESQTWFTRRNVFELFLILFSDGYQPFEHTQYSTDAILLALGNLPLALMRKRENLILVAMIPGTSTAFFFVLVCFRYWLTFWGRVIVTRTHCIVHLI